MTTESFDKIKNSISNMVFVMISLYDNRLYIDAVFEPERICEVNIYHYTDDGVSGTTFDRERFQKMIKAVEENKVSTVIVKDISRFGRDYLKVGFYTEILFKEKGVRCLSPSITE